MRATAFLLLALTVCAARAQQPAAKAPAAPCPITADQASKLDFSPVRAACNTSVPMPQRCDPCLCALNTVFAPVIKASGVDTRSVTKDAATAAITSCLSVVFSPMQRAKVDVFSLMNLQQCTAVPACMKD